MFNRSNSVDDRVFLLPDGSKAPQKWWKKSKYLCPLLFVIALLAIGVAVGLCLYKDAYHDAIELKILSLNCWGVPAAFGAYDKEARMKEIGALISRKEYDIYLLEELWMRNDHATVKSHVPAGYQMTEIYELGPYGTCEGRIAPTGCSGLAIVSKYPFVETEFNVFSVHGDFWNPDGEAEARKGVGRVRIEPAPNTTVDVFVTHTAAVYSPTVDNSYYRQIQTQEVVDHVKASTADFAILGGDFNIDPRMGNETTYSILTTNLSSAMQEFFKYLEELLSPKRATYGNPENTYSASYGPQLYDYIFHRSNGWNSVVINLFEVPFLKALIQEETEDSVADSGSAEKKGRMISLSDHEAITSHILLFKHRYS